MRRVPRLLAALLAGGIGLVAGCGLDTDEAPRAIPRENVPDDLVESPPPSSATTRLDEDEGDTVPVWFVRRDEDAVYLEAVPRTVPAPPTDTSVLQALLLSPPTEDERAQGIGTAIPSTTSLAEPPRREDGGVLVIDVSQGFFEIQSDSLRLAFGQMVCTASTIPDVDEVRFELDGRSVSALDGQGQQVNGPVDCNDYETLQRAEATTEASQPTS